MKAAYTMHEIAQFLDVLNAYEEKPDSLYTLEDARTDLEAQAEYIDDPDFRLDLITPEQYMEAMNYNIINVWHSLRQEKQARSTVENRTTEQLISDFEQTETMRPTMEVTTVRGWIMDELERRNPAAFEKWIDAYNVSPRKNFL